MPDPERTEEPTARRREEARRRGQVARSVELNQAAVLLAVAGLGTACLLDFIHQVEQMATTWLAGSTTFPRTAEAAGALVDAFVVDIARLLGGPLVLLAVVVILVNLAQTRFVVSPEALSPQLDRIHPLNGLRRIFSVRGVVETGRTLLKTVVVASIAWSWLSAAVPALLQMTAHAPREIVAIVCAIGLGLVWRVALVGLVFGAADAVWQYHQLEGQLRMTRQEVRDERRQSEGDPHLRQRMRENQRRMSRSRMLTAVPHADVVVTNPDHIAVALAYREATMIAPEVVAKGGGEVARSIREVAYRFGIPVIENRTVARGIYRKADVGHGIPKDQYNAVAKILVDLVRLRKAGSTTATQASRRSP